MKAQHYPLRSVVLPVAIACVGLIAGYVLLSGPARSSNGLPARDPRLAQVALEPEKFIESNAKPADRETRELVARARITTAYGAASRGDYRSARKALLQAADEAPNDATIHPAYGTVSDQAAYQAAVALAASGQKSEAMAEFFDILKSHKLSPIAYSAHRRLIRMNAGESKPVWDAAMQAAVAAQEKEGRFLSSVCGPKAIEALLGRYRENLAASLDRDVDSLPTKDFRALAKMCGTTDAGTTLDGLQKGLQKLGVKSYGLELTGADLQSVPKPLILLHRDHYVVLLSTEKGALRVYDPMISGESTFLLRADPSSAHTVLAFQVPDLG